jgi:SAM-dependent methyltransferase
MIHPVAAGGFSNNADEYERARPGYPPAALAHLVDVLGLKAGVTVADVAAGTGKLTRLLLTTGARVVAVEPVAAMRDVLLVTCAGAEVVDGTAEALPLADRSVDAVTVAQAFHWFDGHRALEEFARVLAPGGGLAIVYNHRDRHTPWLAAVNSLVEAQRHGTPHHWDGRWRAVLDQGREFVPVLQADFDNPHVLTPAEFVARMQSLSFVGALPVREQAELLAAIADLVATHPGTAGRTELVIGQRTSVHTWRRC